MPTKTRKAELRPAAKKTTKNRAARPASLTDRVNDMANALVAMADLTTALAKVITDRLPEKPPAAVEPAVEAEPEVEEAKLPGWVNFEPDPLLFRLEIVDWNRRGDVEVERLELTEQEYLNCKLHLARMRGVIVPEPEEAANAA